MSSSSGSRAPLLPSNFESNILLLDAAEPRQLARAAALRSAGATVQCARTAEAARLLWKPGSHQLVIIELDDAGADFRQFYDYARAACASQAFAFYIAEPPYLASTPDAQPGKRRAVREFAPARGGAQRRALERAGSQIATARAVHRARRDAAADTIARPSFAEAIKAAEQSAREKDR